MAVSGPVSTAEAEILIKRARDLAARVAARVEEIEASSALPDDIISAFIETELAAVLVPRHRGGFELDVGTVAAIVAIFAAVCPSVAWNFCFYMGQNWVASLLHSDFQDAHFAQGPGAALLAGSLVPTCKLTSAPSGNYIASGRASWCSGAPHAGFIMLAGWTESDGEDRRLLMFTVPRRHVTLVDTWQVEGMRATGSVDVVINDVPVPFEHTMPLADLYAGTSHGSRLYGNPLYSRPAELMALAYQLPVFIGASRGAADALTTLSRSRVHTNSGAAAAGSSATRISVGTNAARAQCAEDMLSAILTDIMRPDAREHFDESRRAAIRARGAMAAHYCRDTVTDAVRTAGANAFRKGAPLQMFFRDINMISLHPFFDSGSTAEALGTCLLAREDA
ncbi:acyl-CoA dehydrogenase family protein [Pseudomonas sp.]|uniref:acyl-CoA dehydrogenase family protein n=1 Tax=Pseudomonas sp. TaxID=306 RepID=UPI003D0C358C